MPRRTAAAVTGAVALATALVLGLPSLAGATFGASTTSTATVRAAADWTPPTVTAAAPGPVVQAVVMLSASAADADSGVASVAFQYAGPDGVWHTACTDDTAPFGCEWDTRGLADGSYQLRTVATDAAGVVATSAITSTRVANTASVVLAEPGDVVRGTTALSATVTSPGSWAVRFEYAVAGATAWKTVCTDSTAPYGCEWATAALNDGDVDLRAVATSGATTLTSALVEDVTVDNSAPVVAMTNPGTPLRGTVALAATATDAASGIASVTLQYAPAGTATYRTACVVEEEPFGCAFDTTTIADGSWSFRAVATDVAGNASTSVPVTGRTVDNTVSSVSVTDPGSYLRGNVTVQASASSTAGVAAVRIQRAPTGTTTWTDLCTDGAAPYSCAWDTTASADGGYDLRAVLVDGAGRTTVSAVVVDRRIDNTPLRGLGLQTSNGGATAGKLEAGDVLTFTYSRQVNLASLTAGWTGAALPVTVRLRDGNLVGTGGYGDVLDVVRGSSAVNLGWVNLRQNYIGNAKQAQFGATMTAGTATVDGLSVTTVTLVVGPQSSGSKPRRVSASSTTVWTPSSAVTDLTGRASSTAPASETGSADWEF